MTDMYDYFVDEISSTTLPISNAKLINEKHFYDYRLNGGAGDLSRAWEMSPLSYSQKYKQITLKFTYDATKINDYNNNDYKTFMQCYNLQEYTNYVKRYSGKSSTLYFDVRINSPLSNGLNMGHYSNCYVIKYLINTNENNIIEVDFDIAVQTN